MSGQSKVNLVLASRSPRRRELLLQSGYGFQIICDDVNEDIGSGETPEFYVKRLSIEKAEGVANKLPQALVLAADTTVVLPVSNGAMSVSDRLAAGKVLGKPSSDVEANEMLRLLSGKEHLVLTSFTLRALQREFSYTEIVVTVVSFRDLLDTEIKRYVASGEPRDKAGAYAIQGGASSFVREIRGSYTNVVGLPMAEVVVKLRELEEAWTCEFNA